MTSIISLRTCHTYQGQTAKYWENSQPRYSGMKEGHTIFFSIKIGRFAEEIDFMGTQRVQCTAETNFICFVQLESKIDL